MRFGTFAAVFAGLLLPFALVVLVPGTFPVSPGSGLPLRAPLCLRLAYVPQPPEWLPQTVRLDTAFASSPAHESVPFYWAAGASMRIWDGSDPRFDDARWQFVGSDSLDITWRGSPTIRLSIVPHNLLGTLTGRAGPSWYGDLLEAETSRHAFSVEASPMPCHR